MAAQNGECPWHGRGTDPDNECERCKELLDGLVQPPKIRKELIDRLAVCTGANDNRPFLGCRTCGDKNGTESCGACGHFFGPKGRGGGWTKASGGDFKDSEGDRCKSRLDFLRRTTQHVPADRNGPPPSQGDDSEGGENEDAVEARGRAEKCHELLRGLESIANEVCTGRGGERWVELKEKFGACCDPNDSNFIEEDSDFFSAAFAAVKAEYEADRTTYLEGKKKVELFLEAFKRGREGTFESARCDAHDLVMLRLKHIRERDIGKADSDLASLRTELIEAEAMLAEDRGYLRKIEGKRGAAVVNAVKVEIEEKEKKKQSILDQIRDREEALTSDLVGDREKRKRQMGVKCGEKYQTPKKARDAYAASGLGRPVKLLKGISDDESTENDERGSGSLGKPKAFKKLLKKQCEYFRDADLKWMASHPDLVRPHFEEVGMMEGRTAMTDGGPSHFHFETSWRFYIDDVLRKIARDTPWHRPSPTDTEAYRVRDENTISPRDRLLEFCELSSINGQDGIEPESTVLSYPARTTTNTYWGISPAGGRSAADVAAWDFFMDLDMQWILNHVEQVEPHYEEVSGMGYRNSVGAVRNVIQMRRMNLPR